MRGVRRGSDSEGRLRFRAVERVRELPGADLMRRVAPLMCETALKPFIMGQLVVVNVVLLDCQ